MGKPISTRHLEKKSKQFSPMSCKVERPMVE